MILHTVTSPALPFLVRQPESTVRQTDGSDHKKKNKQVGETDGERRGGRNAFGRV